MDEYKDIQFDFILYLKAIQPRLINIDKQLIQALEKTLNANTFNKTAAKEITSAINSYKSSLHNIIATSSTRAIDKATDYKQAQYKPFLNKIKDSVPGIDIVKIIPSFGGGMDKDLLNKVWNKAYPDGLNVDDRINRLGLIQQNKIETILKKGITDGESAVNISKELQMSLQMERKAALRLAVNTTNTAYQTAQAELSIQAEFVMGIRIVRGMYGKISPKCPICREHSGTTSKDYYKSDFGGRDIDLWIMTNSPSYHNHCSCGIIDIIEDADTFTRKAREQFRNK